MIKGLKVRAVRQGLANDLVKLEDQARNSEQK